MGALVMLKSARLSEREASERTVTPSDATLVTQACAGDTMAREALFEKHARKAWTLALKLTARRDVADDVLQDAFVTALGDLPKLKAGAAFGAWLGTIVVRQAHRHFRRRRLRRLFGLDQGADEAVLEAFAAPDASPDRLVELARIDAVLRTIDERERSAWVLRHVEGQTLVEVAEGCGCSLATAKRRVAAAERAIALHHDEHGEEDADGER